VYTTIVTYFSFSMTVFCPGWIAQSNEDNSHLKRLTSVDSQVIDGICLLK
jgi:hypothetical protein